MPGPLIEVKDTKVVLHVYPKIKYPEQSMTISKFVRGCYWGWINYSKIHFDNDSRLRNVCMNTFAFLRSLKKQI